MGLRRSTGGRYKRVTTVVYWIISKGYWIDFVFWVDTGVWNDGV